MSDPAIQRDEKTTPAPSLDAARHRITAAVRKLDAAITEKIKRDAIAANTPDPALTALIDALKTDVKKLSAENARLRAALDNASGKLDSTIEQLRARLAG